MSIRLSTKRDRLSDIKGVRIGRKIEQIMIGVGSTLVSVRDISVFVWNVQWVR